MENVLNVLGKRGYLEQFTHENELKNLLSKEKISFYVGFDPTADSLHVGSFIPMMVASHMQKAGHTPIILIGGGTVTISDPTGKTEMRKMMSRETIDYNASKIKEQLSKFISFEGDNAAIMVNNADWLLPLNFIDFMRDIGSLFSVNKMLTAECYKQRLESGLTFFEFGYMLLQSYDFLYLYNTYNCKLQFGGNDQWSNILGGVDLIRRVGKSDSYGFTAKLLVTKEGKKMGKTEKGALWLDPTKTSPYEFYQYWRNIDDADVKNVLCLLTFLDLDEINKLCDLKDEHINEAKRVAAFEITKIVHSEEDALKAEAAAKALFEGNGNLENMPTTKIDNADISILDALVISNLAPSKGQAKILINQGGITLNDNKVSDISYNLTTEDFKDGFVIIKKGKKSFHKLELN